MVFIEYYTWFRVTIGVTVTIIRSHKLLRLLFKI